MCATALREVMLLKALQVSVRVGTCVERAGLGQGRPFRLTRGSGRKVPAPLPFAAYWPADFAPPLCSTPTLSPWMACTCTSRSWPSAWPSPMPKQVLPLGHAAAGC